MTGLAERLNKGDKDAFEELYRQYHSRVYRFAARQANQPSQVEDLVHDIFLRLWENRTSLSAEIPLEAQVFVAAKQVVINFLKRELLKKRIHGDLKRQERTQLEDSSISNPISNLAQLNAAIKDLPPRRRQIFTMSKMDGLTYEEIAGALSISKNTVESQMVKAFKFLRKRLSQLPFF